MMTFGESVGGSLRAVLVVDVVFAGRQETKPSEHLTLRCRVDIYT